MQRCVLRLLLRTEPEWNPYLAYPETFQPINLVKVTYEDFVEDVFKLVAEMILRTHGNTQETHWLLKDVIGADFGGVNSLARMGCVKVRQTVFRSTGTKVFSMALESLPVPAKIIRYLTLEDDKEMCDARLAEMIAVEDAGRGGNQVDDSESGPSFDSSSDDETLPLVASFVEGFIRKLKLKT